eukprot:6492212-Amphidinium_carterae.1
MKIDSTNGERPYIKKKTRNETKIDNFSAIPLFTAQVLKLYNFCVNFVTSGTFGWGTVPNHTFSLAPFSLERPRFSPELPRFSPELP